MLPITSLKNSFEFFIYLLFCSATEKQLSGNATSVRYMVHCVAAFLLFGAKVLDKTPIRYSSAPSHSVYSFDVEQSRLSAGAVRVDMFALLACTHQNKPWLVCHL